MKGFLIKTGSMYYQILDFILKLIKFQSSFPIKDKFFDLCQKRVLTSSLGA